MLEIELPCGVGAQHPAAFGEGFLRQQHAPHIRMDNDRVGGFIRRHGTGQRARLQALTGVGQATLESGFSDPQSLQATWNRASFIMVNMQDRP